MEAKRVTQLTGLRLTDEKMDTELPCQRLGLECTVALLANLIVEDYMVAGILLFALLCASATIQHLDEEMERLVRDLDLELNKLKPHEAAQIPTY